MSIKKTDNEIFLHLASSVLDDIEEMSEKELDYCIKETGLQKDVDKVKSTINSLFGKTDSSLLEATRKAISDQTNNIKVINLPESVEKCRKILSSVISRENDLPEGLTLQNRDGKIPNDEDVVNILEDLVELGFVKESDLDDLDND